MEKIQINGIRKQPLKKKQIIALIQTVCSGLKITPGYLEISFMSDRTIHEYNKTYLNHDYATDIITFNYSLTKKELIAELLISTESAMRNSISFKNKFEEEIVRLISHGLLHLAGFKDKTISQKRIMRKKENELIKIFYGNKQGIN